MVGGKVLSLLRLLCSAEHGGLQLATTQASGSTRHAYRPTLHRPAPGSGPSCPAVPAHTNISRVCITCSRPTTPHHDCTYVHGFVAPRDLAQQLCIRHLKVAVPGHIMLELEGGTRSTRVQAGSIQLYHLTSCRHSAKVASICALRFANVSYRTTGRSVVIAGVCEA